MNAMYYSRWYFWAAFRRREGTRRGQMKRERLLGKLIDKRKHEGILVRVRRE